MVAIAKLTRGLSPVLSLRVPVLTAVPLSVNQERGASSTSLRDYQHACVQSILTELKQQKHHSLATSIATGGGKTVIFSSMIPELLKLQRFENDTANGVLILVHRKELAFQAINTIKRFKSIDDDRIFLDMGPSKVSKVDLTNDSRPFVIVASVPSISRASCQRMDQYPLNKIHSVIVDECHHAVSDSYLLIFDKINKNNKTKPYILGFSATLSRKDKTPLKRVFEKIVFEKRIDELVDENYLCDLEWEKVNVGLNLSEIKLSGGANSDYMLDSLADHVNTDAINELVLKTFIKLQMDFPNHTKSVLAFCVNVDHMRTLTSLFQLNGINAQYVSGNTSSGERDSIVNDFRDRKIQLLFNCGVFTEGTDIPNIDCILLLRPTKSKPLLTQMIGRGLRLHHDKSHLKVIDFVDNQSLGLTFKGTLAGKTESLLKGVGGSPVHKTYDDLLPGETEYIKLTNLKGIKDLINGNGGSQLVQLKRMIQNFNQKLLIPFNLIKYNLWICMLHNYEWCELCVKDGSYVLDRVSKMDSSSTGKRVIFQKRTNIVNSNNFEDVVKEYTSAIVENNRYKELASSYIGRKTSMAKSKITPNQAKFIRGKLIKLGTVQARDALDLNKFESKVDELVNKMSKWEASELISNYTVGGKPVAEYWIRSHLLNTKDNRKALTKDSVIEEAQMKFETGW